MLCAFWITSRTCILLLFTDNILHLVLLDVSVCVCVCVCVLRCCCDCDCALTSRSQFFQTHVCKKRNCDLDQLINNVVRPHVSKQHLWSLSK